MFAFLDVPFVPDSASTIAPQVDALFFFLLGLTLFFTLLVGFLVLYFVIRYRRRSEDEVTPNIEGSMKLEIFWSVVPFIISMFIFVWGATIFFDIARPPEDALEIYVVGKQWMWKLQHPEGQREINQLHVPVGQPVKLIMTSEDVIHDFFMPAFRVKQDVVPGRYHTSWFTATKAGDYHLFCSEYCGTSHSEMGGWIHVMEPADYQEWLNQRAEGSLSLEGRKLFFKLQCITCHSANSMARAPVLEELYGKTVPLQNGGSVVADEAYIRESILKPRAKVVAGWEPIMPSYQGQVEEEDLIKLIAYIKSLRRGETPVRNEATPAPAVDLSVSPGSSPTSSEGAKPKP
jgi:cytochrome c oxidase subunit 2